MLNREKYSAIVLDIDGTMAGPDRVIPDRLKAAAMAAELMGAVVLIATGRMLRSSIHFARELGTRTPVICYQEALTVDSDLTTALRHMRLDEDTANLAVETFDQLGAQINVFVDDEVYIQGATPWSQGDAERMDIEPILVDRLAPLAARRPTLVLSVIEPDAAEVVTAIRSVIGGGANVTHSLPHFCEVGNKAGSKEKALQHLADAWKKPPACFAAFGDGAGDEGMLRWAGLGMAMENGHPGAIRSADRRVVGPLGIAVARILKQLPESDRIAP